MWEVGFYNDGSIMVVIGMVLGSLLLNGVGMFNILDGIVWCSVMLFIFFSNRVYFG